MVLDLKILVEGSVSSLPFETEFEALDISDDIVGGKVKAVGAVSDHSGFITLSGEAIPRFTVNCARCGSEFIYDIPVKLDSKIAARLENDDNDEFIIMDDYRIDIDEIARTALVLELPSRFLCREDCRGLCPRCGADLNENPCSCDTADRDPRWNALLGFFDEE